MSPEKTPNRRPTQYDVAQRAGVSQATVSLILNHSTTISIPDETRKRVLNIMDEIGYVPHRAAQSLRTDKTCTIAVIIPDITNPFYPSFVRGIQDVAKKNDYDLIVYNTDGLMEEEQNCLWSVRWNRVDGLIIVPFHLTDADLQEINIPVVMFTPKPSTPPLVDVIYGDNTAAAYEMTNYLIERGHTRIGMIAGTVDTLARVNRIQGYQQAIAQHHLGLDEILIRDGDFTEAGGYKGMQELLRVSPPVTAVFASNDLMAFGAMIAIREAGLRVPRDIAVAGFDDIPAAKLMNPPLTTVAQYQEKTGQRAGEMLFERLKGTAPDEMRAVEMPFSLIVREST